MDLTTAYENGAFIPDAAAYPDRWAEEAADWRAMTGALGQYRRVEVDGRPMDLFLPSARPAGTVAFVHGGYWKAFGPDWFSWVAKGPMAQDRAVAIPAYPLAPEARIAEMTRHVARAISVVAEVVPRGPIRVAGHSAGGHLAARVACGDVDLGAAADRLAAAIPISPLADLAPLMACEMNGILGIDPAEAEAESPIHRTPRPGVEVVTVVGAEERPAFLDQNRWLAEAWRVPQRVLPGRHHFDVIGGLANPEDPLTALVCGVGAG